MHSYEYQWLDASRFIIPIQLCSHSMAIVVSCLLFSIGVLLLCVRACVSMAELDNSCC